MKHISQIFEEKGREKSPVISFEFFPPKTESGEEKFFARTLPALAKLSPDFCSVTYGAGGGTRKKTLDIVERIQREHALPALAHLTCVGSGRAELEEIITEAKARGIQNILALRGDPPAGETEFRMTEGGFTYAYQLVALLKEIGSFNIGVAGFPEGHPASQDGRETDWLHLKDKIETGADFVITQLFFNNQHFLEFRDYLHRLGVTVPIIPGIIPIQSCSQIQRFTALCGAELPAPLLADLERLQEDPEASLEYGIDYASRQCQELLRDGVPGLHFYSLNKERSTTAILRNLGFVT